VVNGTTEKKEYLVPIVADEAGFGGNLNALN
jgi:isocitrate lyase